MRRVTQVACLIGAFASPVSAADVAMERAISQGRSLTFSQRVTAQESLERVYFSHGNGGPAGSERAVPLVVLQDKVRSYLRKSAALESLWHTTITPQMLRAELERMAAGTRMPDRLRELYRALGDDPILIQEALARPVLVDRLARKQFEAAPPYVKEGSASPPSWDEWWGAAQARFDESSVRIVALDGALPEPAGRTAAAEGAGTAVTSCSPDGFWVPMGSDNVPSRRYGATAVWTGSVMIVWGGQDERGPRDTGGIYDPAIDAWLPVSRVNAPAPRQYHVAVWNGSRMIVWGGYDTWPPSPMNTGALYDPLTDTWTPLDATGAPEGRYDATAVWTGTRMLVWGGTGAGFARLGTGGRYDPVSNTWTAISTTGAPAPRIYHSAVWTGSRMIVWGGSTSSGRVSDGARYDQVTDAWEPLATDEAPSARSNHTAVWTGTEMIVWGGLASAGSVADGGRYDPTTDTWTAMSTSGAPAAADRQSVVWTDSALFVWGGHLGSGGETDEGGTYDPGSDSWTTLPTSGAPAGREWASAVWTGSHVLIWGGRRFGAFLADGGRYDLVAGTWTPIASTPIPPQSRAPVWTGSVAIVWPTVGSGGHKYDPATDTWTPISSAGAPSSPYYGYSKSVWTGSKMIVWGPSGEPFPTPGVGGIYDLATDTWTPTATAGAPGARTGFTAVWTGTRMIVWGGFAAGSDFSPLHDGYSFDPQTNSWSPIATGPFPRAFHSAVWTGSRMVIWGGIVGDAVLGAPTLADGASYDPVTNTWSAVTTTGAPVGRQYHSAIWTGSRMIVWGGETCNGGWQCGQLASGGRYNPTANSWSPVATTGAPLPMGTPLAVWTGQRMIVYRSPGVGGQYIPSTDTWAGVSPVDAPQSILGAVWTGRAMIAGSDLFFPDVNSDADGDGYTPCDGDCNDARSDIGPGAAELCNGVDDDCDGVTDLGGPLLCGDGPDCTVDLCGASRGCLNVPAPDGASCSDGDVCTVADACLAGACMSGAARDADADAHVDAGCGGDDCDDSEPAVWRAPSEVADLAADTGIQTPISWVDQGTLAGPSTAYDLFSGVLAAPAQPDYQTGTCLMTGGPSFFDDARPPAPSIVFWYLARARNGCGTSTWGSPGADGGIHGCP